MVADEPEGPGGVLNIGEVLTRLEPEFPEATVSKIRFLESRGLLAPDARHPATASFRKPTWPA